MPKMVTLQGPGLRIHNDLFRIRIRIFFLDFGSGSAALLQAICTFCIIKMCSNFRTWKVPQENYNLVINLMIYSRKCSHYQYGLLPANILHLAGNIYPMYIRAWICESLCTRRFPVVSYWGLLQGSSAF